MSIEELKKEALLLHPEARAHLARELLASLDTMSEGSTEMSRLFSIHETAENEVNEAADFYDLENPGLGNVF